MCFIQLSIPISVNHIHKMFTKVLITLLVCLNIHLIISAPNSLRSTKDDAEQAFQELVDLHVQLLQAALSNMSRTVAVDLETFIIDKAVNYIYTDTQSKVNQTKLTILKNLQTLEDFGLNSNVCKGNVFSQLDDFFNKIASRVSNCGSVARKILENWLNKTSEEIPKVGTSALSCNSRNLVQCTNYNVDDSCYAGVIDGIEEAKSMISLNYQIVTTAFFTKIADYKLPCQDLLNYEVSNFLSSRLQTVRNCIAVTLKLAKRSSCYVS